MLLAQGVSKARVVILNVASALTAVVGAVATYYFSAILEPYLGSIIAFTAGMFSYIALSDLIPELHHTESRKDTIRQVVALLVGVGIIMFFTTVIGEFGHSV